MAVLTIHATNVTGLGACQVVVSFLDAIEALETPYERIDCHVPEAGPVSEYQPQTDKLRVIPFRRRVPKVLSRLVECSFPSLFFEIGEHLIVLGDVPLRTRRKQVVLVHQPHLQQPHANRWVGRTAKFRVMRALTMLNAPFAVRVIVQTSAMASALSESYPNWKGRDCIQIVGHPPPSWFALRDHDSTLPRHSHGLQLFYPAAGYPHKNHEIFAGLLSHDLDGLIDQVVLTLPSARFPEAPGWLCCVGQLTHAGCLAEYEKADALVFPSFLESYGLPLVEAMVIGIPIIAADQPYARALCGDQAIYFDPESAESLVDACKELQQRLRDGWRPDWSARLATMPPTWQAVVLKFLQALRNDRE